MCPVDYCPCNSCNGWGPEYEDDDSDLRQLPDISISSNSDPYTYPYIHPGTSISRDY